MVERKYVLSLRRLEKLRSTEAVEVLIVSAIWKHALKVPFNFPGTFLPGQCPGMLGPRYAYVRNPDPKGILYVYSFTAFYINYVCM